jgi:YrhK-like protein
MRLFNPDNDTRSQKHKELYALYTLAYTIVDFLAALMFIVGSILFFKEDTAYIATWLFLIGSICFGLRPTITMLRELAYIRAGDYSDLIAD